MANILLGLAGFLVQPTESVETEPSINTAAVAFDLGLGIVFLTFGYGLRSLLNWTRVLAVFAGVVIILAAAAFHGFVAILFQIGFIAALFGPRSKYVCSAEYREIVRQTPGMNRTTGAWIVLLVLAAIAISAAISLPTAVSR